MPQSITDIFSNNRAWADAMTRHRPGFFTGLMAQQKPKYMWIGCSDSRVPANEIMGLDPGEVFVHRNIANVVVHSDLNALSTIQFAVDVIKVKHITVVGHYGCSGVQAALAGTRVGLADNWLRHIQDVRGRHKALIDATPEAWRHDMLVELNAIEQVVNVCQTTVMVDAWARGQDVTVHGWVYGIHDGLLKDLHIGVSSVAALEAAYQTAVASVASAKRMLTSNSTSQ